MKVSDHFRPVMEMPELAFYSDRLRRLVISRARSHILSFPVSPRECILGILRGIVSGLIFVTICLGVFCAVTICFWFFGLLGFASAVLGSLAITGLAAAISRVFA